MTEPGAIRLEVADLDFTYPGRERPALKGVSLSLRAGEFTVIAGRNGAGKSTLALALNGTIPHLLRGKSAGTVLVNGRLVAVPREMASEVGVVFQDYETHLVSSTAALEVAFPMENLAVPPGEMAHRVAETLALVGLEGFDERSPAEISGGEKQRLAIAAAIVTRPSLLVLDEPLTDLDPAGKSGVLAVIGKLRRMGMTIVVIEHDPQALLEADRLVVLVEGSVGYDGPPAGLLGEPGRCRDLGVPVWAPAEVARGLGLPSGPLGVAEVAAAVRAAGFRPVPPPPATAPSVGEPLIEARDLTSGYPGAPDVLFGVSLTIRAGECVALLGQNGSGKTTFAKHAVGLVRPRKGGLLVKGRPVREYGLAGLSRIAGYVFQNPDHQIFSETVLEEVAFGLRNLGLPPGETADRVRESLEVVDLAGREAEDPFSLTKGERQRLAVASLLAYRPEAIFLDEPTTGLDATEAERMMAFIKGLNRGGLMVVLITHAMWAAAEYAERTVVMSHGRVVLDGPTREVFAREDVLAPLTLAPPPAAALANRLGFPAVSASEVLAALKGGPP